jgi:hypothetical protein
MNLQESIRSDLNKINEAGEESDLPSHDPRNMDFTVKYNKLQKEIKDWLDLSVFHSIGLGGMNDSATSSLSGCMVSVVIDSADIDNYNSDDFGFAFRRCLEFNLTRR